MKAPDMAFVSTACPEPQDQTAVDIHPATQHLHDTGFGPLQEFGDEPVQGKDEWRAVVLLVALNGLLGVLLYHGAKWMGWL